MSEYVRTPQDLPNQQRAPCHPLVGLTGYVNGNPPCHKKKQDMLLRTHWAEPLPASAISEKNASMEKARNLLLIEDTWRQREREHLLTSNTDLCALIRGRVQCSKEMPTRTKQTEREAFHRYMKIIYGLLPKIEIDLAETSHPEGFSIHPARSDDKTFDPPPLQEDARPESKGIVPVVVQKNKQERPPAPSSKPKILRIVEPQPAEKVLAKNEEPAEIVSPKERPKPMTPPPPRTPPPLPSRRPTPEVPTFLKQFADAGWFRDLFPDKLSVPCTLSPEDFSSQLLGLLHTCSPPSRVEILAALQSLHSQGLLQDTHKLYQGLLDLVPRFARPPMSSLDRTVLIQMLNLLTRLKSASYDLVKTLLTLLAFKNPFLQETAASMLTGLGVDEVEQWLRPELDTWDSEPHHQPDMWRSLHHRAAGWLHLWTSKYQEHNRYTHLTSTGMWAPSSSSSSSSSPTTTVDVLNYFCSVQKEPRGKAPYVAPVGNTNTVLVPLCHRSQAIFRLGETYGMTRTRRPPGLILPPLRNRPALTDFPKFISLPLSRVTLRPFHIGSDKDWLKASTRSYFLQQQSLVEYYR